MSITLTWNGGQQAIMFQPHGKLMIVTLVILSLGFVFAGLLTLSLLAGIGLALWNIGALLLHLATAVASTDLFVQALALLTVCIVLLRAILFFVRETMKMLCKPVQSAH